MAWYEAPLQDPVTSPSLPQLVNKTKIAAAVLFSVLTRHAVVWGRPMMLMVEPNTACQLHCPHCPTGRRELTRPSGWMSLDEFRWIWDGVQPAPILLQLWNQGEPLIHPDTPGIIRHATRSGARVTLATNVEPLHDPDVAEAVVRSGLHTLILSLDGASARSHTEYRVGGNWNRVEKGVRNMVETKHRLHRKHPILQWQFLLFRHNLHEADEAIRLAREWGVDEIVFKTVQLESRSREDGERWLPPDPKLRRYVLKGNTWVLRRARRPVCARIHGSAVIQWDGTVVPCCFDKNGEFGLGNAKDGGFDRVWRSRTYRRFRQRILTGVRPVMCDNCTEGLTNLYAKKTTFHADGASR